MDWLKKLEDSFGNYPVVSEDSQDTLRRLRIITHLKNKYPGILHTQVFDFVMGLPDLRAVETRFKLLFAIR